MFKLSYFNKVSVIFCWLKLQDYGKQTVGDNIADTMGLQAIFKAYQRKEEKSEISDAVLPGMEDFTNNQLFFLSFANVSITSIITDWELYFKIIR